MYLPRVDERPAAPLSAEAGDGSGTETVLLVEDETALRTLTCRILSAAGYTVLEAESGNEALGVLARYEGPVHLMFTDVVMPGMNGRDLTTAQARPGGRQSRISRILRLSSPGANGLLMKRLPSSRTPWRKMASSV